MLRTPHRPNDPSHNFAEAFHTIRCLDPQVSVGQFFVGAARGAAKVAPLGHRDPGSYRLASGLSIGKYHELRMHEEKVDGFSTKASIKSIDKMFQARYLPRETAVIEEIFNGRDQLIGPRPPPRFHGVSFEPR